MSVWKLHLVALELEVAAFCRISGSIWVVFSWLFLDPFFEKGSLFRGSSYPSLSGSFAMCVLSDTCGLCWSVIGLKHDRRLN